MTSRALAALALGGSLFIILSGYLQTLEASQFQTVSPEIIERYQQTLATDQDNLTLHYLLGVALLQDNQNEAARKQGIAQPGEVLISENTYRIIAEAVHVTQLEPITFKGKNAMVEVYRVDGLRENE